MLNNLNALHHASSVLNNCVLQLFSLLGSLQCKNYALSGYERIWQVLKCNFRRFLVSIVSSHCHLLHCIPLVSTQDAQNPYNERWRFYQILWHYLRILIHLQVLTSPSTSIFFPRSLLLWFSSNYYLFLHPIRPSRTQEKKEVCCIYKSHQWNFFLFKLRFYRSFWVLIHFSWIGFWLLVLYVNASGLGRVWYNFRGILINSSA